MYLCVKLETSLTCTLWCNNSIVNEANVKVRCLKNVKAAFNKNVLQFLNLNEIKFIIQFLSHTGHILSAQ